MQNIWGLAVTALFMVISTNAQGERCKANLPDSSVYTGNCVSGIFNGKGKLVWRDGSAYEGHFNDGLMHGAGKLTHSSGWSNEGTYRDVVAGVKPLLFAAALK